MARDTPRISNGLLTVGAGADSRTIPVGGRAWWRWLTAADTTSFRFEDGQTAFTGRRERQSGGLYWYAYRRSAGRLQKTYVGRSADITRARLDSVAKRLAEPRPELVATERRPRRGLTSPPPKSSQKHNLPAQPTSFVGREREMAQIVLALTGTRLLTLTGTGGVGKTRLAVQVASGLVGNHADGVWLADLAPLGAAELVPRAVASALGVRERAGEPLTEQLVQALRRKDLLLVFDNCEHLVVACAELADALVRGCARVKLLTTSREPLGIPGETVWRVPSLALPDRSLTRPEELVQSEAARLFIERAAAVRSGFAVAPQETALVARVCQQLDGLPLALELAAARLSALSLDQVVQRLEDQFGLLTSGSRTALPRQQTLRATIDWSYVLLPEAERRLFRRLAVFTGGWPLEAAEAVCAGRGTSSEEVLELLARLVAKSLVIAEQPPAGQMRYQVLGMIRQYAADKLHDSDEQTDVTRRHREWYLERAERAEAEHWWAGDWLTWSDWLERELANLRAGLRGAIEDRDVDVSLRFGAALWPFWVIRAYFSEGRAWLTEVLALSEAATTPAPAALGKVLAGAADLACSQGDYGRAHGLAAHGLALARKGADPQGIGVALFVVAKAARGQSDYVAARTAHEEAITLMRGIDNWRWLGVNLDSLARCALEQGDVGSAGAVAAEALAIAQDRGSGSVTGAAPRPAGARPVAGGGPLTPREQEVAALVGKGLGTRDIAEALVIADGTARVHVERILAKLGLHSRAQLAAWAVHKGILSPEEFR